MAFSATFSFHGSLAAFLPKNKQAPITYLFKGTPSIKDAIETIGVPHVEVDVILVNNTPVNFTYLLSPDDQVQIYPKNQFPPGVPLVHLITKFPDFPQFILDVHLGKLARLLRMLGFDALYERNYTDAQIAEIAAAEARIVLTKDVLLLKRKSIEWGYWLRSKHPNEQLLEVLHYFDLQQAIRPFYRCMTCNGCIQRVGKKEVVDLLLPETNKHFEEFYQCSQCHKIYWKGSHYEKMERFIDQFTHSSQC
jgi:hypothetical protein